MGTLCRQDKALSHLSNILGFSPCISPNVQFCPGMLSYAVHNWRWSPRPPLCTWILKLLGHRVRLWHALTFQHQRPHVSITQAIMKDAIFLPCFLPALCLRYSLGKREIQESALCHGGPTARYFLGKGEFTPVLYGLCPPTSSRRLGQWSAPAPKGSLCAGARWWSWLHVGACVRRRTLLPIWSFLLGNFVPCPKT